MDAWVVSSLELSKAAMNILVDIFGPRVHVFLVGQECTCSTLGNNARFSSTYTNLHFEQLYMSSGCSPTHNFVSLCWITNHPQI